MPPASARTPAGAFRIFCGRGRARGPNLKFFAGAGGRGGQISNFLRVRAGAGAKSQKICGRGRARGPTFKIPAGAGGRGEHKNFSGRGRAGPPPARPRAGTRGRPRGQIQNFQKNSEILNLGLKLGWAPTHQNWCRVLSVLAHFVDFY